MNDAPEAAADPFDDPFADDAEFLAPAEVEAAAHPAEVLPRARDRAPEVLEAEVSYAAPATYNPVGDLATYNPVGDLIAGAQAALGEVNVPRIGIHVFGERPDTIAAAETAARDRRLSRASTVVRMGGLETALEVYQGESTPALVIVESHLPGAQLLVELERLAECCDTGTKVVVVGAANDIALYRELMRRGVSEYLVAPIQPLQLISAIGGLYNDPSAPFIGRSIAFVGARGGVGSSTVAHNTAYAVAERMSAETVIVDFDLPFGTAGLDFNQDPLTGVADALSQPERLDPVLLDRLMVRCTDRLSLFAAPASLEQDWDIGPEAFEEVAQRIRTTAPYVVLDLPHQWNAWVRRMMIQADEVVVVATPDLASLRNAKNMIDLVRAARPNDAPPRLVVNQVGVPGRPEIPMKEFSQALGCAPDLVLPFEPKLYGNAANNGQMILETAAKSKTAEGFQHLARIVAKREVIALAAPKPAKTSLVDKILGRSK
jgi:pilus assembly protein CpaE